MHPYLYWYATGSRSVHLADEGVPVGAGGVVPPIGGALVQQHAVHRGACVRLSLRPARVRHRPHPTLFNPHPAATTRHVTAARPPALRTVELCTDKSEKHKSPSRQCELDVSEKILYSVSSARGRSHFASLRYSIL